MTLYFTQIFMKMLNLAFIYKKYDTLRYVTFLYTKSETLRNKQDNLRYVFIYKKLDTLRSAIFHGIFEFAEGVHFYIQKTTHFALHFYIKRMHSSLRLYIYNLLNTT